MQTVGDAQYGPRYLLTAVPFLAMAAAGWFSGDRPRVHWTAAIVLAVLGVLSMVICAVGALQTTMQNDLSTWPFQQDLAKAVAGQVPDRLLAVPALLVLGLVAVVVAWDRRTAWLPPSAAFFQKPQSTAWILGLVLGLAFVVRFWGLGTNPNGFYADETSIGYNAYSISETGKDEWGEPMPLYFKAFGEYKNPVYIYAVVPLIRLFGLSVVSVRLASVLFGTLTVLFTFLLGRKLFGRWAGLLGAAFLALSPWHIQFSRIAFEAISMPCLFTGGFYFLLKALEKPRWAYAAATFLALTPYTYAPVKPLVVVVMIVFALLYRKELWARRWDYLPPLLLFVILEIPLLGATFWGPAQTRFSMLFVGNGRTFWEATGLFFQNYLSHWSPQFLLVSGDANGRHSWHGSGELYFYEFLLGLGGLAFVFFKDKRTFGLLVTWLLMFPVASSLTTDGIPHAIRSMYVLPLFQILGALAAVETAKGLVGPRWPRAWKLCGGTLAAGCLATALVQVPDFFGRYWKDYPRNELDGWDYGLGDAIRHAQAMTDVARFYLPDSIPPVTALFFTAYPPQKWQETHTMDRFVFHPQVLALGKDREGTIVRSSPLNEGGDLLYRVLTPRGDPYWDIVALKHREFRTEILSALAPARIGGLAGNYFARLNFDGLVFQRVDRQVRFDWKNLAPDQRMPQENFSVNWKGWVLADHDGPVTFGLTSDDGSRLFVGTQEVIDHYDPHPAVRKEGTVFLKKGWNPLEIDYYQLGGQASMVFEWKTAGGLWEPVPTDHLGHG